jgi:porin
MGLTGNVKNLVRPVVPLQNVNGVELYYNAAVTPWFHITADLQVIDGANQRRNTAIIPGLRASIVF